MELDFRLHDKQMEVFTHSARFKVCAAGRRGGKSFLLAVMLIIHGLKDENEYGDSLKGKDVFYIAPTFNQGKDIIWNLIIDLAGGIGNGIIEGVRQNEGVIRLVNGRYIKIKGSDRPDTMRGVGISFVGIDEYADMKPEVWDLIIRPALSDVRGKALFIGTPKGKNHFYDLWLFAAEMESQGHPEWGAFQFNSMDNPKLKPEEIEAARNSMSAAAFRQEYEASFSATGGGSLKEEHLRYEYDSPEVGDIYIAIDLAGYGTNEGMVKSAVKKKDEHAIAVVEVSPSGWFVHEIIYGHWDVRETSIRIIKAAKDYRPVAIGIEKGIAYQAVLPYLEDEMKRMGIFPVVEPLTHGGKNKQARITWALQGRAERGRIILKKDQPWIRHFVEQWLDFPNPMAHDDLIDALAYIDQISTTNYNVNIQAEEYEPLDVWTGI